MQLASSRKLIFFAVLLISNAPRISILFCTSAFSGSRSFSLSFTDLHWNWQYSQTVYFYFYSDGANYSVNLPSLARISWENRARILNWCLLSSALINMWGEDRLYFTCGTVAVGNEFISLIHVLSILMRFKCLSKQLIK